MTISRYGSGAYRPEPVGGSVEHVSVRTLQQSPSQRDRSHALGRTAAVAGPLVAAAASVLAARAVPFVGALMWGLVLGAVVANLVAGRTVLGEWASTAKVMLRLGIVLLGLQLSLATVAGLGVGGVVVIVATVTVTFTTTRWVGRRMGLEEDLVTLVAAGFSICGAAAVAAVQGPVRAKERNVVTAVALVTVFGTLTLFGVPWLADLLGLSEQRAAVWAGASIHEVAQVVAASSLIGGAAYPVASAVKLGRVVLLAPVTAVVARGRRTPGVSVVPWFVTAFVAACLLASTGWLPAAATSVASTAATALLAAGMFGLGLGMGVRDLLAIPPRVVLLAAVATVVALAVPLGLVLLLL